MNTQQQQYKEGNMNWFKITDRKIICLETGHELSLDHSSKKYWGIHSTAFQGLIRVFETKDEDKALKEFTNFIKRLNLMEYNEEKEKSQEEESQKITEKETIS